MAPDVSGTILCGLIKSEKGKDVIVIVLYIRLSRGGLREVSQPRSLLSATEYLRFVIINGLDLRIV